MNNLEIFAGTTFSSPQTSILGLHETDLVHRKLNVEDDDETEKVLHGDHHGDEMS